MPTISIKIPQLGEGLQEARLVAFLKQPGDHVSRDEPIYQMETDKAVMDVESPYEGVLTSWLAEVDAIVPIGADVALMEVAQVDESAVTESSPVEVGVPADGPPPSPSARNAHVPPRTRAYAKEKGLTEEQLSMVKAASGKMMPADIDAYLSDREAKGYLERPVSPNQRVLMSRLQRGHHLAVPGTMSVVASWEAIENARTVMQAEGGPFQPSTFTMFAYAVVQAVKDHSVFRSQLVGESTMRTYDHVALGIAVALPGDELVMAVVEDADTLSFREFAERARSRIELARKGQDQASEAVTVNLTNLQRFGIRHGVPVVVPPAIASLFLGEVHNGFDPDPGEPELRRQVNLVLTFDHRLSNGVGAAAFLQAVKKNVETVGGLLH
jgi:pyruvate/2-oxoglutarate dehydrogenase complex dihydrolipoamide acyltransferase (E2) component